MPTPTTPTTALTTDISFMANVNNIVSSLNDNQFIKDLDNNIKEIIHSACISDEERDRLYNAFLQQKLNLLPMAIDLSKTLLKDANGKTMLDYQIETAKLQQEQLALNKEILEFQKDKAKLDKLQTLALLHKNYGYGKATVEELGVPTNDGLLDNQIKGFEKDTFYKIQKTHLETISMMENASVAPPTWMTDVVKHCTEILTDGKLDMNTDTNGTTVIYKPDATSSNGI